MNGDTELRRIVLNELERTPGVNAAGIGVSVQGGIVTLMGHASGPMEKMGAERAAQRVRGVKAVANELQIEPLPKCGPSDTGIARTAASSLAWDELVPRERIRLSVTEGWITLEGDVDQAYERSAAEDAVRNLTGVRGVHNHITVAGRPATPEEEEPEAVFGGLGRIRGRLR